MNTLHRKSYTIHIAAVILLCIIATFLLYFETFVKYQDSLMEYLIKEPAAYVHLNVNHVRGSQAAFVFDAIPEHGRNSFSEFAVVYPNNLEECPLFIMDAKKGVEFAGMPTKLIKSGIRPIVAFSCNPDLLELVSTETSEAFVFTRKERSFFANSMVQAYIKNDIAIPHDSNYQLIRLLESARSQLEQEKNVLFKIEKPAKDSISVSVTTNPLAGTPRILDKDRYFAAEGASLSESFMRHRSLINAFSISAQNMIDAEIQALEQQYAVDSEFRAYVANTLGSAGHIHLSPKNNDAHRENKTIFEKYDIHMVLPKDKKETIELLLENIARRLEPSETRILLEDRTSATELIPANESPLRIEVVEENEIPLNHYYTENGLLNVYSLEYKETIAFSTMKHHLDDAVLPTSHNQSIWDASFFTMFSSFNHVILQSTDERIDLRIQ